MSQSFDTVIFDLGAVLIDWNPRYLYRNIFADEQEMEWFLNHVCTPEWNEEQDGGRSFAEATAALVAKFPDHKTPIEAWYGRWQETMKGPIAGTVNILQELKLAKRHRLYALTNWSAETFPWALNKFDFLHWFDGIVVSGVEKTRKPFPDFYQILLDRYSVHPNRAVFIDDNLRNVKGGEAVGIKGIHFQSPEQLREDLQRLSIL